MKMKGVEKWEQYWHKKKELQTGHKYLDWKLEEGL